MKYMGSKRRMIENGLGDVIARNISDGMRFVDLFTGSATVAWHVAQTHRTSVSAHDLQLFAVILAKAVVDRDFPVSAEKLWNSWVKDATEHLYDATEFKAAKQFDIECWLCEPAAVVERARVLCGASGSPSLVQSYGGYYFSPLQALQIQVLRESLPDAEPSRSVALASLLRATAECAAAPGHTAQPFKPTASAAPYLFEHWKRDVFDRAKRALDDIAPKYAQRPGNAVKGDALTFVDSLGETDLAFVDPPYSNVQYSRFYHVLEAVSQGQALQVAGEGRYPPIGERPQSEYSKKSRSAIAIDTLLQHLAKQGVRTILTFPQGEASNGLSGDRVTEIAERYFSVSRAVVNGRFSTLGGNRISRHARIPAYELLLTLTPSGQASDRRL